VVENRVLRRMVMTGVPEAIKLCTLGQNKGQPGEGILECLIYVAEMRNKPYYWGRTNYGSTWQ
jgi:hypothetical protein